MATNTFDAAFQIPSSPVSQQRHPYSEIRLSTSKKFLLSSPPRHNFLSGLKVLGILRSYTPSLTSRSRADTNEVKASLWYSS